MEKLKVNLNYIKFCLRKKAKKKIDIKKIITTVITVSVSIIEAHRLTEGHMMRSHCVLAVLTVVFEVLPERGGYLFFFGLHAGNLCNC